MSAKFPFRIIPEHSAGKWPHSPTIERLRGFALVLVLIYHGGGIFGGGYWFHGEIGVDIFLLLSGFGLALNCVDQPLGWFLRRRFLRIFPAYWAALALFVGLDDHFFADHRSWPDLVLHVLGLQGFGREIWFMSINDSFWFITLVILCYILFVALRKHLEDLALLVAVCSLVTAALALAYDFTGNGAAAGHLPLRIPDFFLGLILGRLASGGALVLRPTGLLVAATLLLAYLGFNYGVHGYYLLPAVAYVAAFLWLQPWGLRSGAGRAALRGLGFLGTYSYEIYLLHQPLMRSFSLLALYYWWHLDHPTRVQIFGAMTGGLIVAIVGAVLLHRLVELVYGLVGASRPAGTGPPPG